MLIIQAFTIQLKWINVDQSWTDKSLSGRFGVKTKWAKCLTYRKKPVMLYRRAFETPVAYN